MRIHSLLVPLLVLLVLPVGADADSTYPHVRPVGESAARLLEAGRARSLTIRTLIDALDASPVIVHVEQRRTSPGDPPGALRFITRAGVHRYLRITIDILLPLNQALALIGHELQHAVEVAGAGWVVDSSSMETLYEAIGEPCRSGLRRFDTAAARYVGRLVLDELRGRRRPSITSASLDGRPR